MSHHEYLWAKIFFFLGHFSLKNSLIVSDFSTMLVKVTRIIDTEFQRDAATFPCFTAPWIYNEADLVYFQCTIRNSWGILHKSHILPSCILWNSMTRLVLCLFCSEITQFPLKYVLCSSFLVNNLQISSDKQPSLCFLSLFRVFNLKIGQFRILSNCLKDFVHSKCFLVLFNISFI